MTIRITNSICGLDEAGRGALAGPLIACIVYWDTESQNKLNQLKIKLKDGKLLTRKSREAIFLKINEVYIKYSICLIKTSSINHHGIGWANKEIFRRLIAKYEADNYVIDGNLKIPGHKNIKFKISSQPHADATIAPVILAGIIAKVVRDRLMDSYHLKYPMYCWNQNAGYGTKKHIIQLKKFGLCPLHRTLYVTTALKNANKI
jgi:ribonuclease HII